MTGLLERPAPALTVRPVTPDDSAAVRDFLAGLSLDSAYRRFFTGLGSPSSTLVRHLVDVDHDRREAILAVLDGEVVGLADCTRLADGVTVELGVVVADRWQRRGLGPRLARTVLELAVGPRRAAGADARAGRERPGGPAGPPHLAGPGARPGTARCWPGTWRRCPAWVSGQPTGPAARERGRRTRSGPGSGSDQRDAVRAERLGDRLEEGLEAGPAAADRAAGGDARSPCCRRTRSRRCRRAGCRRWSAPCRRRCPRRSSPSR